MEPAKTDNDRRLNHEGGLDPDDKIPIADRLADGAPLDHLPPDVHDGEVDMVYFGKKCLVQDCLEYSYRDTEMGTSSMSGVMGQYNDRGYWIDFSRKSEEIQD